jgi:uncharacterized protein with PQ loop repeat
VAETFEIQMEQIENLLSLIVTKQCAHSLASWNLADSFCFKLLISKALSIGIVLGAIMVKVPQILSILNSSSTKGLALSAILLEQVAITISLLYNFRQLNPFSTYGEGNIKLTRRIHCNPKHNNHILDVQIQKQDHVISRTIHCPNRNGIFLKRNQHEYVIKITNINNLDWDLIQNATGSFKL